MRLRRAKTFWTPIPNSSPVPGRTGKKWHIRRTRMGISGSLGETLPGGRSQTGATRKPEAGGEKIERVSAPSFVHYFEEERGPGGKRTNDRSDHPSEKTVEFPFVRALHPLHVRKKGISAFLNVGPGRQAAAKSFQNTFAWRGETNEKKKGSPRLDRRTSDRKAGLTSLPMSR